MSLLRSALIQSRTDLPRSGNPTCPRRSFDHPLPLGQINSCADVSLCALRDDILAIESDGFLAQEGSRPGVGLMNGVSDAVQLRVCVSQELLLYLVPSFRVCCNSFLDELKEIFHIPFLPLKLPDGGLIHGFKRTHELLSKLLDLLDASFVLFFQPRAKWFFGRLTLIECFLRGFFILLERTSGIRCGELDL